MHLRYFDDLLRRDDIPEPDDGLERIGAGNNRISFRIVDDSSVRSDVEGMVLKRAYPYVEENQREAAVWRAAKGTPYEQYFVPVEATADDYLWILMPYAPDAEAVAPNVLQILQETFDGQDVTANDFGMYQGDARCYDYGTCSVPDSI